LVERILILIGLATIVGCSTGAPGAPTQSDLPLHEGSYSLSFSGFDAVIARDALIPACEGISRVGNVVTTTVTIRRDSDGWRGRASSDRDGNFELRLARAEGPVEFNNLPVSGTLRGRVRNSIPSAGFTADTQVWFGSAAAPDAPLKGTVVPQGYHSSGTIAGEAAFIGMDGTSVTCTPGTVTWSMSGPR
jgi:hypothetical protein